MRRKHIPSPDTLDLLDVYDSPSLTQHRRDVGGQRRFVIRGLCDFALHGTMLTESPGCPMFGHAGLPDDMIHACAATGL